MTDLEAAKMTDISSCIKSQLKSLIPLDKLGQLQGYIDNINIDQSAINGILDKYKIKLNEEIAKQAEAAGSIDAAEKKEVEKTINEFHNTQEATKSIKYTEQIVGETKYTKPVNLHNVDYTTNINYPDRYGHIDTIKNWYVVDKKEKYIEAVNSSGSLFHIDKDGNVSIHITGSLKFIVDKDITLECRGSMDKIVKGSEYKHISGNKSLLVDGPIDNTTMSSLTDKVSASRDFNTGAGFNNVVGAAFVTKAGSIVTTSSGGASSTSGGGFSFTGDISQSGNLNVSGNISASGTIMDAGGNSNHHSH